jgi:peptide/nickel transport system substrate-binding protein
MVRKKALKCQLFAVTAASLLLLVSAAGAEENWLEVAVRVKPSCLYPSELNDAIGTAILKNNVFEGLVRFSPDSFSVEPNLVRDWEIRDGGKVWIFQVKEGITFHDGSPLTALDIVNSIRKNKYFSGVPSVESRMKVKFTMPVRTANLLKVLTNLKNFPARTGEDGSILGTGPFTLQKWDGGNKIHIAAYRGYWGRKPALDGVTFHCLSGPGEALALMREGRLDVLYSVPPSLADEVTSDRGLDLDIIKGSNTLYILINPFRPPLDNAEFRRALNLAVNRREIIRNIFYGQAVECRTYLPPAISSLREQMEVPYNPERARMIFSRYQGSERSFKLVGLPFPRPYCPEPEKLAGMIRGYLEEAGLKVEYTRPDSWESYINDYWNPRVDYDFLITGWLLDTEDPNDFYSCVFGIGNTEDEFNRWWKPERFESLIIDARETVSIRRIWSLLDQAEKVLQEEYPWILISHPHRLGAYGKNVTGLDFSPVNEFYLNEVRIED